MARDAFGIKPIRADQIAEPGEIPEQVFEHLRDDDLVIADLTDANPNVMYELGLRHTRDALTIQIGEKGRLPFDVSVIRTIQFLRNPESMEQARRELAEMVAAGRGGFRQLTPTRVFLGARTKPTTVSETGDLSAVVTVELCLRVVEGNAGGSDVGLFVRLTNATGQAIRNLGVELQQVQRWTEGPVPSGWAEQAWFAPRVLRWPNGNGVKGLPARGSAEMRLAWMDGWGWWIVTDRTGASGDDIQPGKYRVVLEISASRFSTTQATLWFEARVLDGERQLRIIADPSSEEAMNDERERQQRILNRIHQEFAASVSEAGPVGNPAAKHGTAPIPREFVEVRLSQMGELWRRTEYRI